MFNYFLSFVDVLKVLFCFFSYSINQRFKKYHTIKGVLQNLKCSSGSTKFPKTILGTSRISHSPIQIHKRYELMFRFPVR